MAYDKPELEHIWAEGGAVVEPSDTKKQLGWVAEVPPHQYENWVQRRQDQFIFHVNERGIPEWDGQTNYLEGGRSLVQGSNGVVYKSVAASGPTSVVQNPTTDTANTYWVEAYPADDDPRLSDEREWSASTVSQAEAQAGTATTRRAWTAQRVRQAITGWWNGIRANSLPLQSSIPQIPDANNVQQALEGLGGLIGFNQPETKNVSAIANGVLEITPTDGQYITLTGHGSDNYIIEGFGDKCPIGWVVTLVIPRTIGNTGGPVNSLGNYVQFIHSTSGAGFDNEKVKIMRGGTAFRGYQAYPNATDAFGNHAALFEELTYQHVGSGRWVLRKIPDACEIINSYSRVSRSASGDQYTLIDTWSGQQENLNNDLDITESVNNVFRSETAEAFWGAAFHTGDVLPTVSGDASTTLHRWLVRTSVSDPEVRAAVRAISPSGTSFSSSWRISGRGRWKPIV